MGRLAKVSLDICISIWEVKKKKIGDERNRRFLGQTKSFSRASDSKVSGGFLCFSLVSNFFIFIFYLF
jgi:hypothetical protein